MRRPITDGKKSAVLLNDLRVHRRVSMAAFRGGRGGRGGGRRLRRGRAGGRRKTELEVNKKMRSRPIESRSLPPRKKKMMKASSERVDNLWDSFLSACGVPLPSRKQTKHTSEESERGGFDVT